MKHARITIECVSTDKALVKVLENANKYLNKLIAARKKEGDLTITGMRCSIKLALIRAGFADDPQNISILCEHVAAEIALFSVWVYHTNNCFQVAIDMAK